MLSNGRRRLIGWVLPALAARMSERVWKIVDGSLLDGVIEIPRRTDPSEREGVGSPRESARAGGDSRFDV
jgi:hypothetical protein